MRSTLSLRPLLALLPLLPPRSSLPVNPGADSEFMKEIRGAGAVAVRRGRAACRWRPPPPTKRAVGNYRECT